MNKKIITGIVFGLVVTLVFPSINTCATQMNIESDPNIMEQSNFIPPFLIGFWNFNEGNDNIAYDSSGRGNDGTIIGASWTSGVSGNALEFDGDDYVDCGDDIYLEPRTIAAWIKPNDVGSGGSAIVYKLELIDIIDVHGYGLYLDPDDHSVVFVSNNQEYTGGEVPLNEWVHIAVTLDAYEFKIYINGELDSTFTDIQMPISNDAPFLIGGYYFEGSIDEVRIDMNALSESRILELYSDRLPNTPTINGPRFGKTGTEQEYTINAVDPDEDGLYLYIDWGDGNFEYTDYLYPSGTDVIVKHTWETKDKYTIKVKAIEDAESFGLESDWATLSVSMSKNEDIENNDESTRQSILSRLVDGFRGSTDGSGNNLFSAILKLFTPRTPTTDSSLINAIFSKLLNLNLR